MKILRVFIDPYFESKTVPNTKSSANFSPKEEEKKTTLGDYVEFEEVK